MKKFYINKYCLIHISMVFTICCLSFESFGQKGSVINTSFYSKSMMENRDVQIYLPAGYNQQDTVTRYPVIYGLHGANENSQSTPELFPMLDGLISNGSISPVIVVKPDGRAKENPFSTINSWYTNSELYGNIEDYIVFDLVEFIDTSYHTIAFREKRSIMGYSMGALGAMRFALKHPDVYCGVAANSGFPDMSQLSSYIPNILSEYKGLPVTSYYPQAGDMSESVFILSGAYSPNLNNPPYLVDFPLDNMGFWIDSVWTRWNLNNCALLALNLTDTSDLALFFDCGIRDETGAYPFNAGFADTLTKLGLTHVFQSYDGSHLSHYLSRIQIGFQFLDSIMHKSKGVYNVFAIEPFIDNQYLKINVDSVLFRTRISNKFNHTFTPHLIVANSDNTLIDSLLLYDDGIHGDSLANDGLFCAYIPPYQTEEFFKLGVLTKDNQTDKYNITPAHCSFTTAGPVILDSIAYRKTTFFYTIKTYVKNNSETKTIKKPSIKLICNDPWAKSILHDTKDGRDILPGGIESFGSAFQIPYIDSIFSGYFNFKVEISSDGYHYWTDSMRLNTIATGVKPDQQEATFNLEQNYPNPFNSNTKIKYSVSKSSNVTLKVFDIHGKVIDKLVNEEKPAGTYEVNWFAGYLPGGIYFYRLNAGGVIETRKMILNR